MRPTGRNLQLQLNNPGTEAIAVTLERCLYRSRARGTSRCRRAAVTNRGLTPAPASVGMTLRCKPGRLAAPLASRLEDGEHSVSDPLTRSKAL